MGNISSANFKKSKDWQVFHNADERPSYAIGGKLEVNRNSLDALNLKNQIIQDAKDAYERNRKPKSPKFKATSYEWSLVVNLKESSTMQDLETLSKHFNDKYGFQCYQIAIHRDEGHINEQGKKVINHHAHLEFITLDKETGKNRFRGEFVTPKGLRIVQDEVAEILQMKRGVDKRLSGAKRIEPRAYGAMKEREKAQNREREQKIEKKLDSAHKHIQEKNAEIATLKGEKGENENLGREFLTQKQINERFSAERKAMIECGGHTAEGYKAMTALKNELKTQQTTNQQLERVIAQLREKLEKEREARLKAEKERDELQAKLHRAQAQTPQNREISQSSSAANIEQPKPQNDFKTIADRDFKAVLSELKLSVNYHFYEKAEAIYTNSSLHLSQAKQARDKLEQKGYYVQISANNNITERENRIALAFAKTKNAFKSVCEFVSNGWRTIYETSNEKFTEMQMKYGLKPEEPEPKKNIENIHNKMAAIDKTIADTNAMQRVYKSYDEIIAEQQPQESQEVAEMKERVKQSAKKLHTRTKSNDYGFEL